MAVGVMFLLQGWIMGVEERRYVFVVLFGGVSVYIPLHKAKNTMESKTQINESTSNRLFLLLPSSTVPL